MIALITIDIIFCWNFFQLMNKSFEVGSVSRADCPILAAVYNHNINEVITVGAGTFQVGE